MSQHIVPVNDLKEHELSVFCPCAPRIEQTSGESVIIHNSWDMRELLEPDYQPLFNG